MRGLEATGHGGEEDDGGGAVDRCVESVHRPDVLAADVYVHVGRDLVAFDELRPEAREPGDEVEEQLADDLRHVDRRGAEKDALAAKLDEVDVGRIAGELSISELQAVGFLLPGFGLGARNRNRTEITKALEQVMKDRAAD